MASRAASCQCAHLRRPDPGRPHGGARARAREHGGGDRDCARAVHGAAGPADALPEGEGLRAAHGGGRRHARRGHAAHQARERARRVRLEGLPPPKDGEARRRRIVDDGAAKGRRPSSAPVHPASPRRSRRATVDEDAPKPAAAAAVAARRRRRRGSSASTSPETRTASGCRSARFSTRRRAARCSPSCSSRCAGCRRCSSTRRITSSRCATTSRHACMRARAHAHNAHTAHFCLRPDRRWPTCRPMHVADTAQGRDLDMAASLGSLKLDDSGGGLVITRRGFADAPQLRYGSTKGSGELDEQEARAPRRRSCYGRTAHSTARISDLPPRCRRATPISTSPT